MNDIIIVESPRRLKETARAPVRSKKRTLLLVVLWGLFLLLLLVALPGIDRLAAHYPGASVRFSQPVDGAAALAARRHAVDSGEGSFWPTYWSEENLTLEGALFSAEAPCILYSGEGAAVIPLCFLSGGWPGAADEAGCVLSKELAWQLFGGTNVVGKTLTAGDREYTIRGVFEGDDPLALLSAPDGGTPSGWRAAELTGGPEGAAKSDVESLLSAAGLPTDGTILMGWWVPLLAQASLLLPLFIVGVWCVVLLLRDIKGGGMARLLVTAGILLAGAFLLPTLLAALPDRLLPGKWSDFSFWTLLFENAATGVETFLSMAKWTSDLAGYGQVVGQLILSIAFLAVCLLLALRLFTGAGKASK